MNEFLISVMQLILVVLIVGKVYNMPKKRPLPEPPKRQERGEFQKRVDVWF